MNSVRSSHLRQPEADGGHCDPAERRSTARGLARGSVGAAEGSADPMSVPAGGKQMRL
jgi:hypothetical protein